MEISTVALASPVGAVYRASMLFDGGELVVIRHPNKHKPVTLFVDRWGSVVYPIHTQAIVNRIKALQNALDTLI